MTEEMKAQEPVSEVSETEITEMEATGMEATETEVTEMPTHADLAESGLSNRNQKFVYQAIELVENDKQYLPLIQKMQSDLLEGQKVGKTAKQIYGTPAAALGMEVEAHNQQNQGTVYSDFGYWDLAFDNMLTFLMLFSAMFGITLLFQKDASVNAGAAGILALALTSICGGLLFALITKIMARSDLGRILRVISAILAFALWFLIYMLASVLPKVINPVLPGWIYLIVAVAAFAGFRYLRKRTGIVGGFMGGSQVSNKK
ncbi:DUF1129 family protein [Weissella koreensis]|uniref:DUF1129 family protein n=1 Tax=Weissella koreensis TaxID=165096 RepID=A0A7H1MLP8_9LACO|nr:DUF1129 family protein [Weissella koreensis]AVH75180.1 DUF1129 domain-containing protein [Weissella koreensis]EJF33594.1 hypothetical protein JC2156_09560 [Weissella koreensis KCTC 3621]QGN20405.1 DUF1129 family protein [Weissella koreensis]QNT64384.1 DUF1129 family protein [Weissella koreensis]